MSEVIDSSVSPFPSPSPTATGSGADKLLKTSIQFFSVDAAVTEAELVGLFEGVVAVEEPPYRWAYGPKQPDLFYWNVKFDTEEATKLAIDSLTGKQLGGKSIECRIKARRAVEPVVLMPVTAVELQQPRQQQRQKGRPAASSNRKPKPELVLSLGKDEFPSLSSMSSTTSPQQQEGGDKKFSYAAIASTSSPPPSVVVTAVTKPKSKQARKSNEDKLVAVKSATVAMTESPSEEEEPIIEEEKQDEVKTSTAATTSSNAVPAASNSVWSKSFVQVIKEPSTSAIRPFSNTLPSQTTTVTAGDDDAKHNASDNANWRRRNGGQAGTNRKNGGTS
ncbi:hypothetical protein BASA81_007841 [Batrachochytrium salamandrivorans]|nr:hypothetical protein BASA81_007841 [Batrachochytrium salamandrivorans]